jgi:hypothetical protein
MIHHDPTDGGPVCCTNCGTPYVLDVDKGFAFATLDDHRGMFVSVHGDYVTLTALADEPFRTHIRIGQPERVLGLAVVGETAIEWTTLHDMITSAETAMN